MRLAKSLLIGVIAGTVTAVAVGALFVTFSIGSTTQRYSDSDVGGGIEAEVVSINLALPFLAGVVAGVAAFVWHWRRRRPTLG